MIGKNIKNFRIKMNMTQDILAEKLKVTRQAVSNWENNKSEPDLNLLQNIAIVFGISVEELICGNQIVQIISVSKETLPNVRFVGKRYNANESFVTKWKEWEENDWFMILRGTKNVFCNFYVGAKRIVNGTLEYWIGMFLLPNTEIPKGFDYIDISEVNLASLSLCGKAYKLTSFETHNLCLDELVRNEMTRFEDHWCFECFGDKAIEHIGTEKIITIDYKISIL